MRRFFLGIILVLLIGGVSVAVWVSSMEHEPEGHANWVSRSIKDVTALHVRSDLGEYTIEVKGDSWEAKVPGPSGDVVAMAMPDTVQSYLEALMSLEPNRSVGGFDRPGEYGLDSPDASLQVHFGADEQKAVTIKLASDGAGTVYGWQSDSPGLVYEFGEKALETLARPAAFFLDKRVFLFDVDKVRSIQLVQPFGSSWLVEKRTEGFYFTLPGYLEDKPASDSVLKLYLNSLDLIRPSRLLFDDLGKDPIIPAVTIKVWEEKAKEPATVEFFPMPDEPAFYLGRSSRLSLPFTLDSQSVGQLIKSAFDVQGRSIIKLDIGKVARVIVMHGNATYVIERSENGWRLLDTKKPLPGIDMSLWRFTELQFEALPINNLPKTAVRLMFCKLVDERGEQLVELTFYADPSLPQGQCWMKNGGGMFYPVSSRLLKDLQGMFPAGSQEAAVGSASQ